MTAQAQSRRIDPAKITRDRWEELGLCKQCGILPAYRPKLGKPRKFCLECLVAKSRYMATYRKQHAGAQAGRNGAIST